MREKARQRLWSARARVTWPALAALLGRWGRRLGLVVLASLAGLASLGTGPAAAQAQPALGLASLRISLWPEFDQPGTLVILDASLPGGTTLPRDIALRMPAAAGAPHAVAVLGTGGNLLTADYATNPAGEDIIVTISSDSLSFRLEYYDPALRVQGEAREYTFRWTSDYAVAAAAVRVQEPFGAREFSAQPVLAEAGAGEYGLNYWEGSLGALAPGQALSVAITYAKSDDTLSAEAVGAAPVATGPAAPAAASSAARTHWPIVIAAAALGITLFGAGALLFARSGRPIRAAHGRRAGRRRRRASTAPQARTPNPEREGQPVRLSGAAFCAQCGQPLQPGDRFCRQCGAAARA